MQYLFIYSYLECYMSSNNIIAGADVCNLRRKQTRTLRRSGLKGLPSEHQQKKLKDAMFERASPYLFVDKAEDEEKTGLGARICPREAIISLLSRHETESSSKLTLKEVILKLSFDGTRPRNKREITSGSISRVW